jgi:iron complex transport system substrate-binding protein
MQLKTKVIVIGIVLAVILLSCMSFMLNLHYEPQTTPSEEETYISVTDELGRNVTIPENPKRIISLSGDITEILYAIDAGDKIVGVDRFSVYPPEVKNKTCVGSSAGLNVEAVLSLQPDIVLIWAYQESVIPLLEERNVAVVVLDAVSLEDLLHKIEFLGHVCGKTSEAKTLASEMHSKILEIKDITGGLSDAEKPSVYFEGYSPMGSYGSGTFTNELISLSGGVNIAVNETVRYPILANEYIVQANPDVIIVVSSGATLEDIKTRAGWNEIEAVKNDRVYQMDVKWVSANPRIILGLEQLAKWLHPEIFEDQSK